MKQMFAVARRLPELLFAVALTACGGGGGGGGGSGETPATAMLPTLSQDIEPAGPRTDVSALNLFPVHAGDSWIYERREGAAVGTATRTVTNGPDSAGQFDVTEAQNGTPETSSYRLTNAGVVALDSAGAQGALPGLFAALPSMLEYATPLYPAGSERKTIRQGDAGADLDHDGKNDFYRLEIVQVFRGFETLTVLGQATQVARFTNRFAFTVKATKDLSSFTATATEEAYFAPQLGLVRAERAAVGSDGRTIIAPYTMDLVTATIEGQRFDASGSSRSLAVAANALAFDSTRNVYYASQSSAAPEGNRIATVDAASGAVSYSAVLGADPGALAVASDGSALYVGLGSGDVVRLALPSMQELSRVRLPADPSFGQMTANEISASPVAADVFAVALFRPFVSPSHGGVVLVRGMVLQPRLTQNHTGSNRIGFGADGQWLYGANNETSEWGMRRIEVVADGLIERKVVDTGSYHGSFDVRDGLVIVGNQIYRADDSLALLGTAANASTCVKLRGTNKIGCQSALTSFELGIYDASSFAPLASSIFSRGISNTARLVAGPLGAIAVSDGAMLTLFAGPSLQ